MWRVPTLAGPPQSDRIAASIYDAQHPGSAPEGVNNFSCVPSTQRPRPVVLAHGTNATTYRDFSALAPLLIADGYCVFALDYGGMGGDNFGSQDIRTSAAQFGTFVSQVLAATGAGTVDAIGYSQGATVTRYYINKLGGARNVSSWVGIASPSYGGIMYGLVPIVQAVPGGVDLVERVTSTAVAQQMQGSAFLAELNGGSDTVPGVRYTTIASRFDEMIQPFTNIALRGAGATNLVLQDECPRNGSGHFRSVYDPNVQDLVRRALDPDTVPRVPCEVVPVGAGIPQIVLQSNS
ncbi:MAG: alpha/beta fold hydrolase [Rhodococcus sp.]|nr:alpha/beta fold hydrolase [Rhodococcus sp. (in: high G+C Gram-positive bacteria)]